MIFLLHCHLDVGLYCLVGLEHNDDTLVTSKQCPTRLSSWNPCETQRFYLSILQENIHEVFVFRKVHGHLNFALDIISTKQAIRLISWSATNADLYWYSAIFNMIAGIELGFAFS